MIPTNCAHHFVTTCVQGVILEEAQTICGGPEQRIAAVQGNRVTDTSQNGMPLFFFPNVQAEVRKSLDGTEAIVRKKSIADGPWDDYAKKMTAPKCTDKFDFGEGEGRLADPLMKDMGTPRSKQTHAGHETYKQR